MAKRRSNQKVATRPSEAAVQIVGDRSQLHPPASFNFDRWLCNVTLRGVPYQVGLIHDPEVDGICEDRDEKVEGRLRAILISNMAKAPMLAAMHEFIHGWFGTRLSEADVEEFSIDLFAATVKFQAAIEKAKRGRGKKVRT